MRKMVVKLGSSTGCLRESRYDEGFSQFGGCDDGQLSEFGQVVFVRAADLLDASVGSQAFEQPGNLGRRMMRQRRSQRAVGEAADVVFAASDGLEQLLVVRGEQVEATIVAACFADRLGDLAQAMPE